MARDTVARLKHNNKLFEIVVDVDLALKLRKGEKVNIQNALLLNNIFTNSKNGAKAAGADLITAFGTEDVYQIAERIIRKGEMEIPKEYRDQEQENKRKKIMDFYIRNAVDAKNGRPFTIQVISSAMDQAGINIDKRSIDEQIPMITEKIQKILALKIETKKLAITIPVMYTGKVYGIINEYKEKEDWLANGDLMVIVNIPVGLQSEFYDKLNSITHGAALSEEIKSQ
jgi:ribosome maturation protein SDO1